MKQVTLLFCLIFYLGWCPFSMGQTTQTIKGIVLDNSSKQPLIGAEIVLKDSDIKAQTDEKGTFRLENVPLGRQTILCVFWRYEGFAVQSVVVTAGKVVHLKIELSERLGEGDNNTFTDHYRGQNRALNEASLVSTRSFSVEETQRYPASINDHNRMVMAFPEVAFNRDRDADLVIRNNSPVGLNWYLEGVEILNPNHFPTRGGSGGGITAFSASLLTNSDFSSGAFAAEYGNALSGVFDMRFRNGNDESHEFSTRIGIVGLEFGAEGPFKKGRNSYLFNYRYSALALLNAVGLRLVSANSETGFQDLSFKINLPGPNLRSQFSIFGIGGISAQRDFPELDTSEWEKISDYRYRNFQYEMGVVGVNHRYLLNKKSYLNTTVSVQAGRLTYTDDTLTTDFDPTRVFDLNDSQARIGLHLKYNYKFNSQLRLQAGLHFSNTFINITKLRYHPPTEVLDTLTYSGGATNQLLQPYLQLRYKINNNLMMVVGAHSLWSKLNNAYSIEPRIAFRYILGKGHELSAGYGLHSRLYALGTYFARYKDNDVITHPNMDLPLHKTHHAVLGYNWYHPENWHIRLEGYFQQAFNVGVGAAEDSTFSVVNERLGIHDIPLQGVGTARTYGANLTVEKTFSQEYFFLVGASVGKAEYIALNGNIYPTRFDNRFYTTWMAGKEFTFKKGGVLQLVARITYTGGMRYTPPLEGGAHTVDDLVLDYSQVNSARYTNYFRADTRISYRKDVKNISYQLSLDIQNVTNTKNQLEARWDVSTNTLAFDPQSGLVPVLMFQIDF